MQVAKVSEPWCRIFQVQVGIVLGTEPWLLCNKKERIRSDKTVLFVFLQQRLTTYNLLKLTPRGMHSKVVVIRSRLFIWHVLERVGIQTNNNIVTAWLLVYFVIVFHRGNQWCHTKEDLNFHPKPLGSWVSVFKYKSLKSLNWKFKLGLWRALNLDYLNKKKKIRMSKTVLLPLPPTKTYNPLTHSTWDSF